MRYLLASLVVLLHPLLALSQFTISVSSTAAAPVPTAALPAAMCQKPTERYGRMGDGNCDSRCNSWEATSAAARVCSAFAGTAPAPWRAQQLYSEEGVTRVVIMNVDRAQVVDEAACNRAFAGVIQTCLKAVEAPDNDDNPRYMKGAMNAELWNLPGTGYAWFSVGSTKCVKEMGTRV
ncbi:MAG: hypothetical protein M1817_000654 [Caeruleum heppii]|nr:MAG: hypothetical protein M1817_000654 [Caeruleum heppii]